jgi:hypothetical protein
MNRDLSDSEEPQPGSATSRKKWNFDDEVAGRNISMTSSQHLEHNRKSQFYSWSSSAATAQIGVGKSAKVKRTSKREYLPLFHQLSTKYSDSYFLPILPFVTVTAGPYK